MTRAEKLFEILKAKSKEGHALSCMRHCCPGDFGVGQKANGPKCNAAERDCFLCWMAEYKEEE